MRLYFPAQLGHLLNPCDNYFHASLKRRYWRKIDFNPKISLAQKCQFIKEAYFEEKESSIARYFYNCGITGRKDPALVVKHLLSEGLYPHAKFLNLHLSQLESYIHWKFGSDKQIEDVFGENFRLLFDQR